MKNLITYYLLAIVLPLFLMITLLYLGLNRWFFISLLVFAFVYRPLLDGGRLIRKGVIKRNDRWKLFLGYGQVKWFKELYLKK